MRKHFTWGKGAEPSIGKERCGNDKTFKIFSMLAFKQLWFPKVVEYFSNEHLTERDKRQGFGPSSLFALVEQCQKSSLLYDYKH